MARVLGLSDRKGSLAAGRDADIVRLDADLAVDTVDRPGPHEVLVRGPFEPPG